MPTRWSDRVGFFYLRWMISPFADSGKQRILWYDTLIMAESNENNEIIIAAVAKLGGVIGRVKLSQFLAGSKAKWLDDFMDHTYYGALNHLSQTVVLSQVDALLDSGQLQTTGDRRPTVVVPEQAASAPKPKSPPPEPPPVQTPEPPPPVEQPATVDPVNAAISAVVRDLNGLVTPRTVARLLTAGADDIIPFGDHALFGAFHGEMTVAALENHLHKMLEQSQLRLNAQRRLMSG